MSVMYRVIASEGEPGAAPIVHDVGISEINTASVHDVPITVGSDDNRALFTITESHSGVSSVKWYPDGGTAPTYNFTKIGEVDHSGNTGKMTLWMLLDPVTESSGSKVRAVTGGTGGGAGAWALTGVNQTTPYNSVITNEGVSATSDITIPTAAGQTALNGVGWVETNQSPILDPVADGSQTQDFADSFNNSPGRGDSALGGGHGSAAPTWALGDTRKGPMDFGGSP